MHHKSIRNKNKKKRHQHNSLMACNLDGANNRNRTDDLFITSEKKVVKNQ